MRIIGKMQTSCTSENDSLRGRGPRPAAEIVKFERPCNCLTANYKCLFCLFVCLFVFFALFFTVDGKILGRLTLLRPSVLVA